jgi:hypothetical protein
LNPNQVVVAVASMRPATESAATISQPLSRAAASARASASAAVRSSRSGAMSG